MNEQLTSGNRRMHSSNWNKIGEHLNFMHLDSHDTLHSSFVFALVESAFYFLCLLSLVIPFKDISSNPQAKAHHLVYQFLQSDLSLAQLDDTYIIVLMVLIPCIVVCEVVMFALLVYNNVRASIASSPSLIFRLRQLLLIRLTFLLLPTIQLCFVALDKLGLNLLPLVIFMLVMTPLELFLHNIITYDFKYVRSNILQGRNYRYFTIRVIGIWLLGIGFYAVKSHDSDSIRIIFDTVHMVFSSVMVVYRLLMDVYLNRPWIHTCFCLVDSIYLTQSILGILSYILISKDNTISLDLLALVLSTAWYILLSNVRSLKEYTFVDMATGAKLRSSEGISYYFELMYSRYIQRQRGRNNLYLNSLLSDHCRDCVDPLCLCFHIVNRFDSTDGLDCGRYSRQLFGRYEKRFLGSSSNNLVLFNDSKFIGEFKREKQSIVTSRYDTSLKSVRVDLSDNYSESQTDTLLHLKDDVGFHLFICSCLNKAMKTPIRKLYSLAMANFRFLHSEYSNQIAAMVSVYDYVYSFGYGKESSLYTDVILKNALTSSRTILRQTEKTKYDEIFRLSKNSFDVTRVLKFRRRAFDCKNSIKEMVVQKRELYEQLVSVRIDYPKMVSKGTQVYQSIQKMNKELYQLLDEGGIDMIADAINFELFVMEAAQLSIKLRKKVKDLKTRYGNINQDSTVNVASKGRFNPYSFQNVVVFLRNVQKEFRVDYYTNNASSLFGTDGESLRGSPVIEFMPEEVAVVHDQMMFEYINGFSNSKKEGRINTTVITRKGFVRSVILMPKLECLLLDDVLIGGLISYRSKNKHPLVCTDSRGFIHGANKQAAKILTKDVGLAKYSIFSLMPGLLPFYFPAINPESKLSRLSSTLRISQASEKHPKDKQQSKRNSINKKKSKRDDEDTVVPLELFFYQLATILSNDFSLAGKLGQLNLKETASKEPQVEENLEILGEQESKFRYLGVSEEMRKFCKVLSNHFKSSLQKKSAQLFRTRAIVETYCYQRGLEIREITLQTVQPCHSRIKGIFESTAGLKLEDMMESLMVSPEVLNLIHQLVTLHTQLKPLALQIKTSSRLLPRIFSRVETETEETGNPKQLQQARLAPQDLGKRVWSVSPPKSDQSNNIENNLPVRASSSLINIGGMSQEAYKLGLPDDPKVIQLDDPKLEKEKTLNSKEEWSSRKLFLGSDQSGLFENMLADFEDIHLEELGTQQSKKAVECLKTIEEVRSEVQRELRAESLSALFRAVADCKADPSARLRPKSSQRAQDQLFDDLGADPQMPAAQDHLSQASLALSSSHRPKEDAADRNPQAANEQVTTIINSSIHSASSGSEIMRTRLKILKSNKRLKYHKLEYMMYIICISLLITKFIFKGRFQSGVKSIYEYEQSVNKYANLLRPSAFIYKEISKIQLIEKFQIDQAKSPKGSIFSQSQYSHYIQRLRIQLAEITNYVDKRLRIKHSFLDGLSPESISIFGMAYTMLYEFEQLNKELFFQQFVSRKTELRNLKKHAYEIYETVLHAFIHQKASKQDYLDSIYLNFYLNFSTNLQIAVFILILCLAIYRSAYSQHQSAAELLLKIEKDKFSKAEVFLSSSLSYLGVEENQRKEYFYEERQARIRRNQAQIKGIPIKGKKTKKDAKDGIIWGSKDKMTSSFSSYSNFPRKRTIPLFIQLLFVTILLNLSTIWNIFILYRFFAELESSLGSSTDSNLASCSMYIVPGIFYTSLLDQEQSQSLLQSSAYTSSLNHINEYKSVRDKYIYNLVVNSRICDLAESILDGEGTADCLFSVGGDPNFTLFKSVHRYLELYNEMHVTIVDSNDQKVKEYFEGEIFFAFEQLTFFQIVDIRKVSEEFMMRILSSIDAIASLSGVLTYLFLVILLVFFLGLRFLWLPSQSLPWTQIRSVLLILNDDVLSNMYLKSYFGFGRD